MFFITRDLGYVNKIYRGLSAPEHRSATDDGSFGTATSGSGSAMARGINPIMAASIVTETSAAAFRKNVKCTHEWLPACATTASSTNNGWAAKSDDGRPFSGKLGV